MTTTCSSDCVVTDLMRVRCALTQRGQESVCVLFAGLTDDRVVELQLIICTQQPKPGPEKNQNCPTGTIYSRHRKVPWTKTSDVFYYVEEETLNMTKSVYSTAEHSGFVKEYLKITKE